MKKKTENRPKGKKKKKRFDWLSLILFFIVLIGAAIIAYPTVSDWWNSFHQSRAIATYANIVENTSQEEMEKMLEDARVYNVKLQSTPNRFKMDEKDLEEYNSLLNLTGTGVMGYIQINEIGVNLPVYHGTEEAVLQIAIGHIEGTSLPIGGEGTHSVLSGHRGLPSAKLFTDLDKLVEGSTFTVTVLNHTSTYEVDQIRIVLPSELSDLNIVSGEDYCTLVTCTPYGVNTHRMLVRGHRIENVAGEVVVVPGAIRIPNYIVVPAVGIPLLFLFLIGMLIYYRRKSPDLSEEELIRRYKGIKEAEEEEPSKAEIAEAVGAEIARQAAAAETPEEDASDEVKGSEWPDEDTPDAESSDMEDEAADEAEEPEEEASDEAEEPEEEASDEAEEPETEAADEAEEPEEEGNDGTESAETQGEDDSEENGEKISDRETRS